MPDLNTPVHMDMFHDFKKRSRHRWLARLSRAFQREWRAIHLYGVEWGDPEFFEPLKFIRNRYVIPFVDPEKTAMEIGPGGGRWTKYLLKFKKLYAVDYHSQLLKELKRNLNSRHIEFIRNNGTDFPGVPEHSVDYVFSFDAFVHFDEPIIRSYLGNIKRILTPSGHVVIHYSDHTKIMAQVNAAFSYNTPQKMREMVAAAGFKIVGEDLTTMWHSSIIHFTL